MNARAESGFEPRNPVVSILDIGLTTINEQFSLMMLHEAETLAGNNVEALHDMRVASRRLRVAVKVFNKALKTPIPDIIRGYLRETGHKLGDVRDFDVLIQMIGEEQITISPDENLALRYLYNFCEGKRSFFHKEMVRYFNSQPYHQFKDFFRKFNVQGFIQIESATNKTALKSFAASAIRKKQLALLSSYKLNRNTPIEILHRLRIDVKKLRYTVEFLLELLCPGAAKYLEILKVIQDQLGSIHDIHFLILLGETYTHNKPFVDTYQKTEMDFVISNLNQYLKRKKGDLDEMIDRFLNNYENSHLDRVDFY